MDMRVKFELLIPSVQYAEKADLCTEMFRIASDFEKGLKSGHIAGRRSCPAAK